MEYGLKADVYAYGVVLHELLTHQQPWDGLEMHEITARVAQGRRLNVPPELQEEAPGWCALMRACWAQDPEQRPVFQAIWDQLREMLATQQGPSPWQQEERGAVLARQESTRSAAEYSREGSLYGQMHSTDVTVDMLTGAGRLSVPLLSSPSGGAAAVNSTAQ